MYGTDKLKQALDFGIGLGMALDKKLEDGKLTLWEGFGLAPTLKDLPDLIQNAGQIWKEFIDLNQEEKNELISYLNENFDTQNDKAEEVIQAVFKCVMELTSLYNTVKVEFSKDDSVGGGGPGGGDPGGGG